MKEMIEVMGRLGCAGAVPQMAQIVEMTAHDDEKMWVPYDKDSWFRPLMFDLTSGTHVEISRMRRGAMVNRHLHPTPVLAWSLAGVWSYLEHDWKAEDGMFLYEPAGEVHSLICESDEMQALFIYATNIYLDENDKIIGFDDNQTLIDRCRRHYGENGVGADYVDRLLR